VKSVFPFKSLPSGWPVWLIPVVFLFALAVYSRAQADANQYLPLVMRNPATGTVTGKVMDATSKIGIAGAQVCYTSRCVSTLAEPEDQKGYYTIDKVGVGEPLLSANAEGYWGETSSTEVISGQVSLMNFALSPVELITLPVGVDYRVLLTWGENADWPNGFANDLDAHLMVDSLLDFHVWYECLLPKEPPPGGGEFDPECYYYRGKTTVFPYARLLVDEQLGFGPETIDISIQEPTLTYHYLVTIANKQVEGIPAFSENDVNVKVFGSEGKIKDYSPPAGDGNTWYLFRMEVENETGQIIDANCVLWWPPDSPTPPTCP